jgi:archaellum component FlaC
VSDNSTQETPDSRSFEERVFARFDSLDGRTDRMEARMDRFENRLESKVGAIESRLAGLEEKVDARLRETRPIWESMLVRLESIEKEVKAVGRGVMLLHDDNLRIRIDQQELRERVEQLESPSTR